MKIKLLIIILMALFILGCAKTTEETAPTIISKEVKVTKINIGEQGCLGDIIKINGNLNLDTKDFMNDIYFSVIDEENSVLVEERKKMQKGDNDFSIQFKPKKEGKQEFKLLIDYKDKTVYSKKFSVNIQKPMLLVDINDDEKSYEGKYYYITTFTLGNEGICDINNIKVLVDIMDLKSGSSMITNDEFMDLITYFSEYPPPTDDSEIWKRSQKRNELGNKLKSNTIEEYGLFLIKPRRTSPNQFGFFHTSTDYEEDKEYKIILTVKADGVEPITKEHIVHINKVNKE